MRLVFLSLCLFSGLSAAPLQVEIQARSAILINADTGAILFEKNAFEQLYPASTTKIATALYALEEKKVDLTQRVTVSGEAVRHNPHKRTDSIISYLLESDATLMGLIKGEVLTVDALLHGLMMVSGNDAANAIAEHVSGSITTFVDELNEYVQRLGCKNTHFKNPHGYHHGEHLSTAYEMCLIMKRALQVPKFLEIIQKPTYLRPQSNKRAAAEMKQFNALVVPTNKHYYSKSLGGKTGYYSKAGCCLVSAATHDGRTLIAGVFGAPKNAQRFIDTRRLFDAAFAEKRLQRALVRTDQVFKKDVEGASKALGAKLGNDLKLTYFPAEEPQVRAFIHWAPPELPIQKGDVVGEVRILDAANVVVAKENLHATEAVPATFFYSIKQKWKRFWR